MNFLQTFQVFPKVPEQLKFLEVLVRNLWWCWNLEVIDLFRRINPKLWEESGRNPIIFFTMIDQNQLDRLAKDTSFLTNMAEVREKFTHDVMQPFADAGPRPRGEKEVIAYFSMEFGIHESLPLFAGGLGILAGDHLKASSDLGLPIVGVGLFYTKGYFHQYLNHDGWQQEEYPATNLYHLPVERVKDPSDNELRISIMGPDGIIQLAIWKIAVGRVSLFLLDTNIKENPPAIREINSRLYRSTGKVRLAQEVILGIGGMRALKAMGYTPVVCHMNEGHCSFSTIERLAQIRAQHQVDLKTAIEINARTTVFTTHTPVPAGYDEFPPNMVRPYMVPYETVLGISADELVRWGQVEGTDPYRPFSMFVLGLHLTQDLNGVSELHGRVARRMWAHVWPRLPEEETPISHITNGVHIPSWISIENALLYQRYLGRDWALKAWNSELSGRIVDIYDEELWRAHEMSRTRLIRSCRKWMAQQYGRRNAPKSVMKEAESVLDDGVLTIAFARRFASYKRATLLLRDMNRFEAILKSEECPVQFIFAGKAHPRDDEGKRLIQQLVHFARHPLYRHKILFLENYDINIARHLVQGADVWLNTPRRPMEACGTSGMKAAANGVLNVSILDGWWNEGYRPERGWRIGNGEEYRDHNYQDTVESQALYNIIENEVAPLYYDRAAGGTPKAWLKMMKASMKMAMSDYCSLRMISEYEERFYLPGSRRFEELTADKGAEARQLSQQHHRLLERWHQIQVSAPVRSAKGPFRVNQSFEVTTIVQTGELRPEELNVELYYGKMRHLDRIDEPRTKMMHVKETRSTGAYLYACHLPCTDSGRYGFTVRVTPNADAWIRYRPELLTWA